MSDITPAPDLDGEIPCTLCEKRIPASQAVSVETADYVIRFCGGQCDAAWLGELPSDMDGPLEAEEGREAGID